MTITANSWNKQIRSAIASLSALAGVGLLSPPSARAQYTYQQLAVFPSSVGAGTDSTLAIGANGNVYGVSNSNTIFQYSPTTHAITPFVKIDMGTWGNAQSVISDSQGNLFGIASAGVFEVAAGTTNVTSLATFNSSYAEPVGRLAIDTQGNLYGTTALGGVNNDGSIYEINGSTHALTTIHSFNGADGQEPLSGVLTDSQGNLYGTTGFGGVAGQGTIFKLNIATQQLTKLWEFVGGDGARPKGELVSDSNGNLFGNASVAGSYDGTVFKVLGGSEGNTGAIHDFSAVDGANPSGQLALGPNGQIFGTTPFGGLHAYGTVFELTPTSGFPPSPYAYAYTDLHDFSGPDGVEPLGGLVSDLAGNIYGATLNGDNGGVLFELTAVPEPAAFGALTIGAIPLIRRRRGR